MTQIVDIPGQGPAEFPDDMSHEQIAASIRKTFPVMDEKAKKSPKGMFQRAGEAVGRTIKKKFIEDPIGAAEAGLSLVTGIGADIGNRVGTLAGIVRSGHLGDQKAQNEAAGPPSLQGYQPRTEGGKSFLEATGDFLEKNPIASKLQGAAPDLALGSQLTRSVRPTVQRVLPAAEQAARKTAEVTQAAGGKVLDKTAQILTPMPEKKVAELAKKAVDLGIPLSPHQLSTNKIARMVGETLEKLPLSGSKAKQRQIGFNRALGKLIGAEESDHLKPDVFSNAMDKAGEKIGEISAQTPIVFKDLKDALDVHALEIAKYETRDVKHIVGNYIRDFQSAAKSGVIDGTQFRKLQSKIKERIRSTPDGDLRNALADLNDTLEDAIERNISSPEKLAELKDARRKYAIGLTIEPLVAKATTTGDISPGGLLSRVTADKAGKRRMARGRGGELGDLAEIGKLFLKEPPSSGTAERALAYGTVGTLSTGAFLEPHTAAAGTAAIAGANVYNRVGPRLVARALRNTEAKKADTRSRKRTKKQERQYLLREAMEADAEVKEQTPLKKAVGE